MDRLASEEEDNMCEFDIPEEFENQKNRVYYFNGGEYEGGWKYGKPHGYGVYKKLYNFEWPHGKEERLYRGEWRNGKKHGCGILKQKETLSLVCNDFECLGGEEYTYTYKGRWYNGDKFEGIKTNYNEDGIEIYKYDGCFSMLSKDGSGSAKYRDGKICKENWQEGKRHGLQTCTYSDGKICQENWRKGKRHGLQTCTSPNGEQSESMWREGRLSWEDKNWVTP